MDFNNTKHAQGTQVGWLQQIKDAVSGIRRVSAEEESLQWHLDFPSAERPIKIAPGGIVVLGWVLLPASQAHLLEDVRVVAHWGGPFELTHSLNVERPDVIKRVFGSQRLNHPQRRCGFRFTIPVTVKEFELELIVADERVSLEHVAIKADSIPKTKAPQPLKVIEGKEGWLFLDNDTNGSVDQYCGNMRLTEQGLGQWQNYLKGFASLAQQHKAQPALLVSPSKESVMGPRYHSLKEGVGGPIQQLLALPEARNFIYPIAALKALGDDAFIRTDTHWASKGAMAAVKELTSTLGFDRNEVDTTFAKDKYKSHTIAGDLGNKFDPVRKCQTDVMISFNYPKHRYFDNGLPNFGRLILLTFDKALNPGTCLMFGSSSSYFMLNYLGRLFKRIVFVHTAGNLDPELTAAIKPDYLLVQTNARFVVQVPKTNQALSALIKEKRARLTDAETELLKTRQVAVNEDDELIQTLGLAPWVSL